MISRFSKNYYDGWESSLPSVKGGFLNYRLGLLAHAFPELRLPGPRCPKCMGSGFLDMATTIQHLVDVHDMPREDIADWLASL